MSKRKPKSVVTIEFKDPDFAYALEDAGVKRDVVERLQDDAVFGEYWTLHLHMNSDGTVKKVEFGR